MSKKKIKDSLAELEKIAGWFESSDEIDVEEGLSKVKEGAKMIKELKKQLEEVENEFEEIKADLND